MTEDLQPWRVVHSETVFAIPGRLEVTAERVRLPDGREVPNYWRVALNPYVIVFAEAEDGRVLTFRQYRHGPRRIVSCLPAGQIEPGEEPLAAARRELLEETGHEAARWQPLGSFVTAGNAGGSTAHAFRATGCRPVAAPHSGDLEEQLLILLSHDELRAAVRAGRFATAGDLSCIALAMV